MNLRKMVMMTKDKHKELAAENDRLRGLLREIIRVKESPAQLYDAIEAAQTAMEAKPCILNSVSVFKIN